MTIKNAIAQLSQQQDLDAEMMTQSMQQIMTGQATDAQIGAFLMALQLKGETVIEITAAAQVMRELASTVDINAPILVDTCGTGGDNAHTFNVSTASAFVVSAAGATVAKHGNRSISSRSGSADVLEAAGVNIDLSPTQVKYCIEKIGIGFMFAQQHHSAMKHAIGPRKELGIKSLFNLLGPLTNPARASHQLLGVYDKKWVLPMAEVLQSLGCQRALVVSARDGLDEISIAAPTDVAELKAGNIKQYTLDPSQFGFYSTDLEALTINNPNASLATIFSVFDGQSGPARDIISLNAGAAIYTAELTDTLHDGIEMAKQILDKGKARQQLDTLIAYSQQL